MPEVGQGGSDQDREEAGEWTLVCASASVLRDWERLKKRRPEAAANCETHLRKTPLLRKPGRVYPWRGQAAEGRWEFEVTSGDRVVYRVASEERVVIMLFAGAHPAGRYGCR